MKKNFEDWYAELIKKSVELKEDESEGKKERLKKNRKKYKYANIIAIAIIIIIDAILLILFAKMMNNISEFFWILIFIDFLIYAIVETIFFPPSVQHSEKSRELYKKTVITNLINNFFNEVYYKSDEKMPYDLYNEAKYPIDYDEYNSSDYFEGLIDNKYKVKIANIRTTKNEGDIDIPVPVIKFHGIFARIEIKKSIGTRMTIRPKDILLSNKKIEIDNQEFKRYFDVISDNKIVTMKILTSEIIESLISLQRITNNDSWISIYDNKLYLRMPTGVIFESGKLNNDIIEVDKEELHRDYRIIEKIYSISKIIINSIENTDI